MWRVVLGELAHPHDAVQRAVRLVAVAAAELGQADRQVAIAGDALLEDQDVRRAVHRLQRHQVGLARQHRRVVLGRWASRRGRRTYSRDTCPSGRDCSHWRASISCGVLTSSIAGGVEPAAHIGFELAPDDDSPWGARRPMPCASAWRWNRSISWPILRWSRLAASSSRTRCASSCFLLSQPVP